MKKSKNRQLINALVLIAFVLCFGFLRLQHQQLRSQPAGSRQVNTNRTVSFARLQKSRQPVWPSKMLGVTVTSKEQKLRRAAKQACQNWQPAFSFQYEKTVKRNIFIKTGKLPRKGGQQILAVTQEPTVRHGLIINHKLTITVAPRTIKKSSTAFLASVLTHELGHALSLPHSRNKKDLMYRTFRRPKHLTAREKQMVEKIYSKRLHK